MSTSADLTGFFREATTSLVRTGFTFHKKRELTVRQLGMLLTAYSPKKEHTVGSLAKDLNISKSAVTRGLKVLKAMELVRCGKHPSDQRRTLVHRTTAGVNYLHELGCALQNAASVSGIAASSSLMNSADLSIFALHGNEERGS